MPDMNTLKITYLSEIPLKITNALMLTTFIFFVVYLMFYILKLFIIKDEDCNNSINFCRPSVLFLSIVLWFCFFAIFTAPYADVCVKVVPNMDIREFDMNRSRDFIKKGDDYYFAKTIEISLIEKFRAEQGEEGLSDVIKWSIERSVSGTKGGEK